jgi:hypothetical protein
MLNNLETNIFFNRHVARSIHMFCGCIITVTGTAMVRVRTGCLWVSYHTQNKQLLFTTTLATA